MNTHFHHEVIIPPDDGKASTFIWHWPRGTFRKRMSALEIAAFILPHMIAICSMGLLRCSHNLRIHDEFKAMLQNLALSDPRLIDRLLPWIKSVTHTADDDLIVMRIDAQGIETGTTYSIPGLN